MYRLAIVAVAALIATAGTARPVSAASNWQLCLRDEPLLESNFYYLNFSVQGNAVLVSGTKNTFGDDHGPVFGSLSKAHLGPWELGLTVTIANGGDYANPNTENIVFVFNANGSITYKRWQSSGLTFVQGFATAFTCPE
jgi:hypothetical protein